MKKLISVFLIGSIIFSCKKKDVQDNPTQQPPDLASKVKDSVLLYSREIYLWYQQIPSSFNAQGYADPNAIMTAIRTYSIEPGFTQPVDRWSFAYTKQDWDNLSSGVSKDFGIYVFFLAEGDLRVKSVERDSPAGLAGVRRGWRLTSINGSTNITTTNASFIVNAVYQSPSGSFTFQKPDGSSVNINLTATSYQTHPVFLDSVYTVGAQKVGYLSFNSFLGDTLEIYNEFQRIFNRFAQQGVTDVAVDLRYNGGGYVTVQQKLANYLIKTSANGQLAMKQQYNDKYSSFNSSANFSKLGSLNLNRVFFIVSSSTASASELVINDLKPYMDVKLVGPANTYGKPVGYFPIPVGNWYIFPVSFRSTNGSNEGSYFNGLTVNKQVADGLDKDWGDINESCFASILRYINTGNFRTIPSGQTEQIYKPDLQVSSANTILDKPTFKGTIEMRKTF